MNILSKIRLVSSFIWSKIGNSNLSIFFGFVFTIGGLISLFQNSNWFFNKLTLNLGGVYGYSTEFIVFIIGWFLLLFGILNKIRWSKYRGNLFKNETLFSKKLNLKNQIAIIVSVLFFTSVVLTYYKVRNDNINQKSEELKKEVQKVEERLKELDIIN